MARFLRLTISGDPVLVGVDRIAYARPERGHPTVDDPVGPLGNRTAIYFGTQGGVIVDQPFADVAGLLASQEGP